MTRRAACYILASNELRDHPNDHAAAMRAKRIIEGCSGRRLPKVFEARIRELMGVKTTLLFDGKPVNEIRDMLDPA